MNELIPTIPRVYTALAQWAGCMVYILSYRNQIRLRGWRFPVVAAAGLALLSLELILTGNLPLMFWIPGMVGSAAIMFLFIWMSCDMSYLAAGYCCVRAFVLSEFAASLEWQLYWFCIGRDMSQGNLVEFLFAVTVFAVVFALAFFLERGDEGNRTGEVVQVREFVSALCIGIIIFTISNLSFVTANTPFSGSVAAEIFSIRTFVDLGGVAVLYAYHMQHRALQTRYELDAIHNVLQTQYAQYKQSRESMELINRKYHDLKHQIAALRAEPDAQRRNAWLDAMEDEIVSYEVQSKTGNSVLDTVLTSKKLYCQKHKIMLTTVVDGGLLDFMDAMDICTIFGNALDNAVEAVLQMPEKEKRLIHLTVTAYRGFVLIRVENYFEGELKFDGGNPVSTKGDDKFHGFGVKSIRYSAQRYGGTVSIETKKNWFELKLLIPLPKN